MKAFINRLLQTNSKNVAALIVRLAVAVVIFPHGAQKLLGWFGGRGFSETMYIFTEMIHIPWILVLLVIAAEFFGSLLLAIGAFTRLAALFISFNFIGVLIVDIGVSRFFMNWQKAAGQGEGLEYFILLFGLLIASMIMGGGAASVDATVISKKKNTSKE